MTLASQANLSESASPSIISKRYTLLELQYDGTNYKGWQFQPNLPTVQGELLRALTQINSGHVPTVVGSGRTDSGVHALAQFAKVTWENTMPNSKIVTALNGTLAKDIRVVSASDCSQLFHPTLDAKRKIYRYYFSIGRVSPLLSRFVCEQRWPVDIEQMNRAAQIFIGSHDFHNFRTVGTPVKSTVREIFKSEVRQASELHYDAETPIWVYEVEGAGFLKQMVRLMVSALFEIGRGRVGQEQLEEALTDKPLKRRLGAVAPPQGLVLYKVIYSGIN
jgi:tRNA pseudouridine38-40 synthase